MWYSFSMTSSINTRNFNKFCHFHHDYDHDTKKCYAIKKRDKNIDLQGMYLIIYVVRETT